MAIPAAGVVALSISSLESWVLRTDELNNTALNVAFFVGLATFTQLISMALANWRDRRIVIRLITALPISIFLALSPALMIGSIAEYIMPGWEDGGSVGLPVFVVSFAACALWLALSSTGRQATSRGCGLIALTAFAIPVYTIGVAIVTAPVQNPIFHPWFVVTLTIIVGAPVGLISAAAWYGLRETEKPSWHSNATTIRKNKMAIFLTEEEVRRLLPIG